MGEWQAYHDFAISLVKEAGEIARAHFGEPLTVETKSDHSPLTIADTVINNLVIEKCKAAYPAIGILGEEASEAGSDTRLLWVCDPIDGTLLYSLGIPASTICLALVADGVPVVGVVYDFNQDKLYSAIKGGPALCNGAPMVQAGKTMRAIDMTNSHASGFDLTKLHAAMIAKRTRVLKVATTALMGVKVAEGHILGQVYSSQSPWDIAASKVIAEAAGCKVTDIFGKAQRYDQTINGAIIARTDYFDELLAEVTQAMEEV